MVFEHLGELLMNATRDSIDPAMRAAAEDVSSDFPEIVPLDTRLLMGFFVSLRRMLVECGVQDFSFADLVRPTHETTGEDTVVHDQLRAVSGESDTCDR